MIRKQRLEFGPFEFDVPRSLLFRDNAPLALGQRGAALLAVLLKRRGEVLTKADLIDAAWPEVMVEEANLSVQISLLRRALGRAPDGGEWIVTVPRTGYRFLPEASARMPTARGPTLAISPFTDFDTGAQPEADGLVEDLTTAMSRFKSIIVMARDCRFQRRRRIVDARQFTELDADYVLEGSLRRIGDRLRTNVQLIDGTTGSHLWAEVFDRSAGDHGASDRMVNRIAGLLEPQILNAEIARSCADRPNGMSPRDLYLRARSLMQSTEEKSHAAAYRLLQRALVLEPENIHILAWASVALHHGIAVGWTPIGPDDRQASLDLANRALALGVDDSGDLGLISNTMFTAREWDMGRLTMERAVELNPNSSTALICAGQGALYMVSNKAEDYYQRAFALGPLDPNRHFTLNGLAVLERRRGNYETAIELAKGALAACPTFSGAHWQLITATAYAGRIDEARHYLGRYRAVSPNATIASIGTGQPIVDERLLDHLLEGLWEAGLPEG